MNQLRYGLMAGSLALIVMGAGCSATTDTNVNADVANTETDTTNVNTTDEVDAAGGTSLTGSDDANTNDTPTTSDTTSAVPANLNGEVDENVDEMVVAEDGEDTAAETKTFDVVASQFAFSPDTLTVNVGDTVVINLTSSDVPHGFSLSDFGISETITPGKTKTVEFVADQAGTFSFTCSVVCGAGHSGMRGSLVVN